MMNRAILWFLMVTFFVARSHSEKNEILRSLEDLLNNRNKTEVESVRLFVQFCATSEDNNCYTLYYNKHSQDEVGKIMEFHPPVDDQASPSTTKQFFSQPPFPPHFNYYPSNVRSNGQSGSQFPDERNFYSSPDKQSDTFGKDSEDKDIDSQSNEFYGKTRLVFLNTDPDDVKSRQVNSEESTKEVVKDHEVKAEFKDSSSSQIVFIRPQANAYKHSINLVQNSRRPQNTTVYVLPQKDKHHIDIIDKRVEPTQEGKPHLYYLSRDPLENGQNYKTESETLVPASNIEDNIPRPSIKLRNKDTKISYTQGRR